MIDYYDRLFQMLSRVRPARPSRDSASILSAAAGAVATPAQVRTMVFLVHLKLKGLKEKEATYHFMVVPLSLGLGIAVVVAWQSTIGFFFCELPRFWWSGGDCEVLEAQVVEGWMLSPLLPCSFDRHSHRRHGGGLLLLLHGHEHLCSWWFLEESALCFPFDELALRC